VETFDTIQISLRGGEQIATIGLGARNSKLFLSLVSGTDLLELLAGITGSINRG
jgi:hypothetical protein